MENLEIENLTVFKKDSDNEVCITSYNDWEQINTSHYLNQEEVKKLIEFLQNQLIK